MMQSPSDQLREPFDIYVVGLGIMGVRHVTREAEDCLRASRTAYFVDHGFGIPQYLANLGPRPIALLGEYAEGRNRIETYRKMAAIVIDAALSDPPVCFATYGHPTVFVYPSLLIQRAAAVLELRVHVVPGISIFDAAFIDLGLDPGLTGLQIFEASTLLADKRTLQSDVPCLLLQVDSVESAFYTRRLSRPERFMGLQEHLLRFYPAEHEVVTLFSPTFPILPPIINRFALRDLPEHCASTAQSGTMYIPPMLTIPDRDELFIAQLSDPEHLLSITRPRLPYPHDEGTE
jgi:precorrin-3B methylase